MAQPIFRNPDKFQVLPYREWLRCNMPSGGGGFVVEDLDLVLRVYGPNFHADDDGKFMFIELKYGNIGIGRAQYKTFGLIDKILHKGDPDASQYKGYFVLNYTDEDWDNSTFKVNHAHDLLSMDELIEFLSFRRADIRCYF